MGQDDKDNKKSPHSGYHTKDGEAESGVFYGHQVAYYRTSAVGTLDHEHAAHDGKKNHRTRVYPHGGYESHQQNDDNKKQITHHQHPGHYREHTPKGHSQHTVQHKERFSGKTDNANSGGDRYRQGKKDRAGGYSKNYGTVSENQVRLKSKSNDASASGDTMTITNTPGSRSDHNNNSGVKTHGDVKYDIFKEDAGAHYQKNGDLGATKKMQVQSLKDDMMVTAQEKDVKIEAKKANVDIKAKSKITLTVGGSSITIESSKVTIKAQEIILDGTCHLGGQGGQLAGKCGGGCASRVFVN